MLIRQLHNLCFTVCCWVVRFNHAAYGTRFPYWTDGNVPLVALLKASNALDQLPSDLPLDEIIDRYMKCILDHDLQDGWIKHDAQWTPASSLQESRYQIVQTLMQWSETHPTYRKKVATAIISQLTHESTQIIPENIQSWTATRWPSYITLISYAVHRLVPEFKNYPDVFPLGAAKTTKLLIDSADLMGEIGMDWHRHPLTELATEVFHTDQCRHGMCTITESTMLRGCSVEKVAIIRPKPKREEIDNALTHIYYVLPRTQKPHLEIRKLDSSRLPTRMHIE